MNLLQKVNLTSFTGSKKKENGNHLSEDNSFFVLDLIPTPAAYITPDHHYRYINKAYAEWFEVNQQDVIGRHVKDFLGDDAYAFIKPFMEKAFSGTAISYEAEIPFRQGLKCIEATYTPDFDASGKVKGYMGLIKDVTDKKYFENQLQKKQEELEDYVSNATVGMHWVDESGKIIWANKAELDMLGYTSEEYIGHSIREFHADRELIDDILNRLKNKETVNQYEAVMKCKDRSFRTILINSNVLWENGRFVHSRCFTTDITERKKILDAFKESEVNYRQLMNSLPIAVYTCDENGYVQMYNEKAVELWGREPEKGKDLWCGSWKMFEVNGKTPVLFEDCPMAVALKERRPVFGKELIVERPDGTRRYIIPHPQPIFNSEKKLIGGVNAVVDITGQKRALKRVEETERRYHNLIQKLPAAIYTTDQNGIITLYNEAAVALWGRRPQIGKDMWCGSFKIFEPDGVTEVPLDECPMAIALKEKRKVVSNEPFIVERPDGVRRHFMPHPEPIFDLDGNMNGAINMLVDVTESKLSEEQKARLAAIIQSSGDAIISKNLDSIITSWNLAAERIFGYSAEEMIGQSILKLFPENKKDEENFILDQIKKGKLVDHYETKRIKKDGSPIDVSVTISAIKGSKGNIIGASKIARDITQQRESEKLMHEKEERLRMAIESAKLGTWEYDPTTFTLICSEESRQICGLPENMQPGFELVSEHIYADDKEYFYNAIKTAIDPAGDGRFDLQLRFYRYGDRELKWVRVQGKVFFNTEQQPVRLIGTMLDITEEKLKEQELINSVEVFQTMAENAPAMIWMSGTDKFNDYFNRTWLDFTGRTLQEEGNEGWLDGVHPDDLQKCIETYNESLKDQKGFYKEYRLRRHDGQYRWIADNAIPRFSPAGEFLGFISACIDIDDQKKFREKILDSELLFKTISNAAPVGLWMADTTGKNTFVNDTWVEWTDIPAEKQLQSGWLEKVVEEDKETAASKFHEAVSKREKYTSEFRIIRKDGQLRWCLTEGYPYYNVNGEPMGYAGSVTDITDIRALEQRKDDFIKMASHELKTPITSINGYVQLLLNIYNESASGTLPVSNAKIQMALKTIDKQVTKMTRLISELLDLSKIESGQLELHTTNFNLQEVVEEAVQDARYTTSHHAIIFQSDFDGAIHADRDRLGQVLTNILNNAIKYSADSDKIDVEVKKNGKYALIYIRDYGIGIDKKDQQKIFERFYRAEGKNEQTYPGFGIGLFIANEIVQRHHGSIKVKSEKNKGSEFTITLPLKAEINIQ